MSNALRVVLLPALATLVFTTTGCVGRPGFIPTTRHLYERFTPLAEPRPEVPVGALWIDGYGATGEGASGDNIITTRSLSGLTFDADFQASLTLGLLKFLDLDPSIRKKVVARFGDLSIIQVKDWSRLSGPPEEPRIYEALKAGTISITTTGTVGLDIENHALSQGTAVVGRGTTGLARTFIIDGKDLVFAIHVASYRPVETEPVRMIVSRKKPVMAMLGRYGLTLSVAGNDEADSRNACVRQLAYRLESRARANTGSTGTIELDTNGGQRIINVPVSEEGLGGALLTQLRMTWNSLDEARCSVARIKIQQIGHGIVRQPNPGAPGW